MHQRFAYASDKKDSVLTVYYSTIAISYAGKIKHAHSFVLQASFDHLSEIVMQASILQ